MKETYAYTQQQLKAVLLESGLKKGSVVFITTGLGFLGKPQGVTSTSDLCDLHLTALTDIVGNSGLLIIPTYSYTFGKSTSKELAIYDPLTTPSEIGPFPNYVIKCGLGQRSLDPMMSVYCIGNNANQLLCDLPNSSYAEGSVFSRLLEFDAICLSIGLGPNWTPFIHYLDYINQVPYRYEKLFWGIIENHDYSKVYPWYYTVPARIKNADGDCQRVSQYAYSRGIWGKYALGKSYVCSCRYDDYFKLMKESSKSFLFATAKGPPVNVLDADKKRVDIRAQLAQTSSFIPQSICISGTSLTPIVKAVHNHLCDLTIDHLGIESGSVISNLVVPEACRQISTKVTHVSCGDCVVVNPEYFTVIGHSRSFNGQLPLKTPNTTLISVDSRIFKPPSSQSKLTHFNALIPAFAIKVCLSQLDFTLDQSFLSVEHYSESYKSLMELVWLRPSTKLTSSNRLLIFDSLRMGSSLSLTSRHLSIIKAFLDKNIEVAIGPIEYVRAFFNHFHPYIQVMNIKSELHTKLVTEHESLPHRFSLVKNRVHGLSFLIT